MNNDPVTITISDIFTTAGSVMTGFMDLAVKFFEGLWANPMGQVIIGLGLVSGAIALCYRLFLRRKSI